MHDLRSKMIKCGETGIDMHLDKTRPFFKALFRHNHRAIASRDSIALKTRLAICG